LPFNTSYWTSVLRKRARIIVIPPWDPAVGIEIKFNRRYPASKEKSSILEDVRKAKGHRKGYVLWLNYDRPISEKHVEKVKSLAKKYGNVKLFFLDLFTEPFKTNLPELQRRKGFSNYSQRQL
jgi:hypothetical protein